MAFDLERPTTYRTESDIDAHIAEIAPRMLGALLNMLVATLAAIDSVNAVSNLRMTDFATFLRAFDKAHGTGAEDEYRRNLADSFYDAFEADEFAQAVVSLVQNRGPWVGTTGELLVELNATVGVLLGARPEHWPRSARAVTNWLERSQVVLSQAGVQFEWSPPTQPRPRCPRPNGWESRTLPERGTEPPPRGPYITSFDHRMGLCATKPQREALAPGKTST